MKKCKTCGSNHINVYFAGKDTRHYECGKCGNIETKVLKKTK